MSDSFLNIYNNLVKLTRNKKLYFSQEQDNFYGRMIIFFFHLSILLKVYKNKEKKKYYRIYLIIVLDRLSYQLGRWDMEMQL